MKTNNQLFINSVSAQTNQFNGITDEKGEVSFSHVPGGTHKLYISYYGLSGEQSVKISGPAPKQLITASITQISNPLGMPIWGWGLFAGMSIAILWLFFSKRKD